MCDAYNNYYNIIAYTFATYAAKERIPFDQDFRKFRFKIKWNRKFCFENFSSPLEVVLENCGLVVPNFLWVISPRLHTLLREKFVSFSHKYQGRVEL